MKIAVIEDSKKIGYIVYKTFERENIDVKIFETLKEAKEIETGQYAAYIVDYNLKDGTGLEFVKYVREKYKDNTPILMLTVRQDIGDKIDSFNAGADDYLTKPFEIAELVARIKALIKRSTPTPTQNVQTINRITFDMNKMEITYKNKKIPFSKKEYQLIAYLLHNRGQVIDKDKILDNVWINSNEKTLNIVNVYINRIRKKLQQANAPELISTVRGFGYTIK